MTGTRKNLGWGGLVLGALLLALPAMGQGDHCEADCATKASEPLQACVRTCPQPGSGKDMKSTTAYQSCAARCSTRFQDRFKTCKSKCPAKGQDKKTIKK